MQHLIQFLASGVTVGAIYAMVALGFTLIYNSSHVVNFAQGEFVMLGGMITASLWIAGVPLMFAAIAAVTIAAATGVFLYEFALRPATNASVISLIIITIGASILLRGIAQVVFGTEVLSLPGMFGDKPIVIEGVAILPQSLVVVASALVVVAGFWLFMERTLVGKAVYATATNPAAAQLMGISTRAMIRFTFVISAAIGALAGIMITPISLMSHDAGTMLALKGFAASMLGGMGSPIGAVVGGLILGLLESLSAGFISSKYKDATAFILIVLVLFVFPSGLLGRASHERI
jgi:branched-chain amino acid transport system permease protein